MKGSRTGLVLLALAVALAAGTPAFVEGSGFQLIEQNGSGLGNAFAGQAAGVRDASAVFFNPAALTRINGRQFVVSVEPIGMGTDFADVRSGRPFLPVQTGLVLPVAGGGLGGDAGAWIPVPNGYVSWQVASPLWVGLGVNAPFGLKTEWDADWIGRFHAIKSEVKTLNINPTVALKVNDVLSLGAGVSYQRLQAELTQSVAYGGIAFGAAGSLAGPAAAAGILAQLGGPAGLAREGIGSIEGDSWAWGWNVGALVRVGDGSLAATYRSKVAHEVEGDAAFANAPAFLTTGPLGALGAGLNARFASGPVRTEIELPDTVSLAAAWEGDKLELLADWTWTGWSKVQEMAVVRTDGGALSTLPLRFEDTWRAGFGVSYRLDPRFKLRLGTAYDHTPVQDQFRTPRLPDQDRTWAATGFEWKVSEKAAVDVGYAHLFLDQAASNRPNQETAASAPAGALVGDYSAKVDIVSVQFRLSF